MVKETKYYDILGVSLALSTARLDRHQTKIFRLIPQHQRLS